MRPSQTKWRRRAVGALLVAPLGYAVLAYGVAPALWRHYEHHPAMEGAPKKTTTAAGLPGDPLNIGLVGRQEEVVRAFLTAGWAPADPITLRTSLAIVESVLLRRADPTAPVSPLFLWGRRQDLAFEQAVGASARERHHVRLWRSDALGVDGRPFWLGAATFDRGVGIGHRTGQVTHHIAPDIDAERAALMTDLVRAGQVTHLYQVTGVGPTLLGRNGEGDRYFTDGEVTVAVLSHGNAPRSQPPERLPNPAPVTLKNRVWAWARTLL
ncbi:LssY C-terminal domain-containing protein [Rhodospirillaceae bacterium SYSU D60014]|uniref:LssY C-terminal domain-containing protein n=1 Tax=Virgifigura deserti TaxID=2268457 RepID=UPI000E67510F